MSVPTGYPAPLCTSYPWWRFDDVLADVAPDIDGAALAGIRRAIDEHGGWIEASGGVDGWVLCHGDVHPANVIAGPDGPVIIDWDLLCVGPPGWDHAPLRSMVERWGAHPGWYADFASGYGEDLCARPGDPFADRAATRRGHADAGQGRPHRTRSPAPRPPAASATGAATPTPRPGRCPDGLCHVRSRVDAI